MYSYGILLMETFTINKPTNDICIGEMSLKHGVKSLPISTMDIIDTNLLENKRLDYAAVEELMSLVMRLALDCCVELPE